MKQNDTGDIVRETSLVLHQIAEGAPDIPELAYFLRLVQKHFAPERRGKQVVVLGQCVPEELIYASGAVPYWVTGGSPYAASLSGDALPRDTDPVSRAMLGCLKAPAMAWAREALVLIPVTNDSGRKLAYLLRQDGYRVHTIDFPPSKLPEAEAAWTLQMERCAEALASYTGKRPTRSRIRRTANTLDQCAAFIPRFLSVSEGRLSSVWRMLILFSYACTQDAAEWAARLSELSTALEKRMRPWNTQPRPRILLMGSPVSFPNYKVPFLLQEIGLSISVFLDPTMLRFLSRQKAIGKDPLNAFFNADCSGAYAQNQVLLDHAARIMDAMALDGVV